MGKRMVDGQCQDPAAIESKPSMGHTCGCHAKVASATDEEEVIPLSTVPVNLSISYGNCYKLTFPDGKELGSNRENFLYTPGGLFQQIPFRICTSTRDCSIGGNVTHKGKFYLEDRVGFYNDPEGKTGWIASHDKGSRMQFTWDVYQAEQFEGAMVCAEMDCPLRLSGVPKALRFSPIDCGDDSEPLAPLQVQRAASEL